MLLLPLLLLAPIAPQAGPVEPMCIRAGDVPREFTGWYGRLATRPQIGAPFAMTAQAKMWRVKGADPARPGGAAEASFTVQRAATYRIALGEAAWIDVMRNGQSIESVAHTHGPICTGMRKIVDFRLMPGRYHLHLSGMKMATLKVMIVPAPGTPPVR